MHYSIVPVLSNRLLEVNLRLLRKWKTQHILLHAFLVCCTTSDKVDVKSSVEEERELQTHNVVASLQLPEAWWFIALSILALRKINLINMSYNNMNHTQ